MNARYSALAVLMALGLTLSAAGQLGATEMGPFHSGKGTVLAVDPQEGQLVLAEDALGSIVLALNGQTQIVDEVESPIVAAGLRTGDLVREECFFAGDGTRTAKRIRLLRPAWMDTASPEQ